jgi:hypothetical protein
MRASFGVFGAVGVVVAVMASASESRADDAAAAQALFDQGKKAMAAHDFAAACTEFEDSFRLDPAMGTLLNLADCKERNGKLASAWSLFLELAAKAREAGQAERARIGRQRAAALAPRLSHLVIHPPGPESPPGLEVKRDGTVVGSAEWGVPIPADAGSHTIDAAAPGKLPWSTSVDLGSHAETVTVSVPELKAAPPEAPLDVAGPPAPATPAVAESPAMEPPPPHGLGTQKIVALAVGGLGVAGVAVGTYFGLASMSKHTQASGDCGPEDTVCTGSKGSQGVQLWSDARTAGNISTAAFIVGAAGIAGATVLWFTAPKARGTAPGTGLLVGPGSLQWKGTW